jgi:alpha-glucosidase
MWDFTSTPWLVGPTGPLGPEGSVDFFVLLGPDLPSLRRVLMSLLGRPPLPPKSVFAPWVIAGDKPSYQNWRDFFADLAQLKGDFDKLVAVLLPNPPEIPPLMDAAAAGVELLVVESPYLPADSAFFADLVKHGFMVRQRLPNGPALTLNYRGRASGLIDYTNPAAASYWHALGRSSYVAQGARLFYLVGGEPEVYTSNAWYAGISDPGSHSQYAWGQRYSLKWMEGFWLGLANQIFAPGENPRLFLLSRAGLAGLGRQGAGLLTAEPNVFFAQGSGQARSHLNMSGVDYYSTDISSMLASAPLDRSNLVYEAWLAKNVMLNLPLVVPAAIAAEPWARFNMAIKAKFVPYYYSLAYQAWLTGDPIVAPLFFYFQDDLLARESAFETMLGPWVLVASGVNPGSETLEFHLPAGRWYDYHGREVIDKKAGGPHTMASKYQGISVSPLLLRSGAIIPTAMGNGSDPSSFHILAFPGEAPTSFVWYEDNGLTRNYAQGDMATTVLELSPASPQSPLTLTIKARQAGPRYSLSGGRSYLIEIVGVNKTGVATLDGQLHTRLAREELLDLVDSGWLNIGDGRLLFKTNTLDPAMDHEIVVQ